MAGPADAPLIARGARGGAGTGDGPHGSHVGDAHQHGRTAESPSRGAPDAAAAVAVVLQLLPPHDEERCHLPRTRAYVRALTLFRAPLPRRAFLYLAPLRTSSAEDMRERTQSQRSSAEAPESAEALKSSAEAHKSSAEAHETSAEFPAGAPSAEGAAKKQRFLRKLPRDGSSPLLGKKRIEHGRQKRTPRRTHAPFEAVQQLLTRRIQIRQR